MLRVSSDDAALVHPHDTVLNRSRIVDAVHKAKLPAAYGGSEFAEAGVSYGANVVELFYGAAAFVDRILKGARPATGGSGDRGWDRSRGDAGVRSSAMTHRRSLSAAVTAFVVLLTGCALPPRLLEPSQPGWERIFTIDWEAGEHRGTPTVKGYPQNASPYPVWRIQLLIDALDASGRIIAQKAAWLAGDEMEPFSRRYFEVPAPQAAPQYRVRVYSYDRSEAPDGGGSGPSPR